MVLAAVFDRSKSKQVVFSSLSTPIPHPELSLQPWGGGASERYLGSPLPVLLPQQLEISWEEGEGQGVQAGWGAGFYPPEALNRPEPP